MNDDQLGQPADPTMYLEALVKEYADRIYRYAFSLTANEQDAQDLFQDTFLRAFVAVNNNREEIKAPHAWLRTIMKHAFYNSLRHTKRVKKGAVEQSLDEIIALSLSELEELLEAPPDIIAASNEGVEKIHQEISNLRDGVQDAISLLLEGYKYSEIAQQLHQPTGTVKSNIHDGKKLLRAALEEWINDGR